MIRDWNPADGDACQGDICLFRVPDTLKIATHEEIAPRDGRLLIQEGEVTGHHHAIRSPEPVMFRDDGMARASLKSAGVKTGSAKLYRDTAAAQALVNAGELTRTNLCIGFLLVEGTPVVISHEEHDGIRIPVGCYYVGRQVESAGAEERIVVD